jgi:hypothetical protein
MPYAIATTTDLRLLDDLGLGDDGRSQVPVTMPAEELAETFARLRADARGGLTESPKTAATANSRKQTGAVIG